MTTLGITSRSRRLLFTTLIAGCACLGVSFSACSGDDDNGGTGGSAGTVSSGGSAGVAGTGGASGNAGSAGSAQAGNGGSGGTSAEAGQTLTDNQIAGLLQVANAGEIQQANAALPHLSAGPIRNFAVTMRDAHTQSLAALNALLDLLPDGGSPDGASSGGTGGTGDGGDAGARLMAEMSAQAQQLKAASDAIVQQLSSADAGSVDMLYVNSQVQVHQSVLNLLDTQVVPAVQNRALKDYVTNVRTAVASHLAMAQALAADAGTGDASTADGS